MHFQQNAHCLREFASWPLMKFEYESPEETEILNLIIDIEEARRKSEPTDGLIEQKNQVYESWIERLTQKQKGANKEQMEDITRELKRAQIEYGTK